MDGGVGHGAEPSGRSVGLLAEASSVGEGIRSAAAREAAEVLVAAAHEADRLLALADQHAEEVRAAAAARADSLRRAAAESAEAETSSAGRRARDVVLAAVYEGERVREEAHERGRRRGLEAERQAEEILTASRRRVAATYSAAQEVADRLPAERALELENELAQLRQSHEEAARKRAVAEREAVRRREEADRQAARRTEEAQADLQLARRVRSIARRDASELLAHAMGEAAQTLQRAAREFDAANELLVEEARGRHDGVAPAPELLEETRVVSPEIPSQEEPEPDLPPAPAGPLLVPVLTFRQELLLRLLVLAGLATAAWFWLWWLATGHGEWTFGSVMATALLAWVFGLSGYFFFFICRMSRPNRALAAPDLRVAMVVTKAPGEAWPVLERTIEAMLTQAFDRPYDVWLADERPTLETLLWCLDRGVKVSTRFGVEEYHRPTWPRRTRSKEGNLAWFYDTFGYDKYDVVVQLDADHVPTPTYLVEMVRPFADPKVGYVAAPSICDANVHEGWTVRGRLYREASMHGPVQAGCNGGYAPVCIGSHYAVRTAALREIGGIGPELAEDYSTTLWFLSAGWDGVFNIDAVAHGDGPATVEEMLVQEIQWSRSLGTISVRWAPQKLRTVPWRARPRLAFALIFYPLSGLVVALAAAAPVLGVALRTSWGNTSLAGFYLHLWPHTLVSLALVVFLRRCMLLRPVNGKVWSWELLLFQLVRWPWTVWGFLQGIYAGMRSDVINFRVTPKSVPGARALPPRYLLPTLLLGAVPAWIIVLVSDPGPAVGLMILAALQSTVYLAGACLVVVLHLTANRRRARATRPAAPEGTPSRWQAGGAAVFATVTVVAPTMTALLWRLSTL